MYKLKDLEKYEYFKGIDLNYAIDSLTGTLTRKNILGFAKDLIKKKAPFTMCIMDVDNFKSINDNFGHKCGDECLNMLGESLMKYVGEDGLVGRFGGDEFVIIYFGKHDYDSIYKYIFEMFMCGKIVRKKIKFDNQSVFLTATLGCATFPEDSETYDELFTEVDKALYRGKSKGRNCFIIYVEEKHKNINVYEKDAEQLSNMLKKINKIIINNQFESFNKKIGMIMSYVCEVTGLDRVTYIMTNKETITSTNQNIHKINDDCLELLDKFVSTDEVYTPVNLEYLRKINPKVDHFLNERKLTTFSVSRVSYYKKTFGYIFLAESQIERIWQDKDIALLMYLDRVIMTLHLEEESNK